MSEKFFFNRERERLPLQNRVTLPPDKDIRPNLDNEIKIRI